MKSTPHSIPASDLMLSGEGSIYHLRMQPSDVVDTIILVGSPSRVDLVKQYLVDAKEIAYHREFRSAVGMYRGQRIGVLSHGIGCGCIDIVLNELDALANIDLQARQAHGGHRRLRLVRIGTAGSISPQLHAGEAIITSLAVGFDGLGWYYESTAALNERLCVSALQDHLSWPGELPRPYAVRTTPDLVGRFRHLGETGITVSAPGFFAPQSRMLRLAPRLRGLVERVGTFTYDGMPVLNLEMESASLTVLARALGHETVTITLAIDNRQADTTMVDYHARMEELIGSVLSALVA